MDRLGLQKRRLDYVHRALGGQGRQIDAKVNWWDAFDRTAQQRNRFVCFLPSPIPCGVSDATFFPRRRPYTPRPFPAAMLQNTNTVHMTLVPSNPSETFYGGPYSCHTFRALTCLLSFLFLFPISPNFLKDFIIFSHFERAFLADRFSSSRKKPGHPNSRCKRGWRLKNGQPGTSLQAAATFQPSFHRNGEEERQAQNSTTAK